MRKDHHIPDHDGQPLNPPAPLAERRSASPAPAQPRGGYGYNYGYNPYDAPPAGDDTGESGLLDYYRILMRRKGALILATFLGGVLALLVTLPQTPIYQAHTSLEIQNLNADFMGMDDGNPVEAPQGLNKTDIETQIEVLKSETLIDRALAKLDWTPPPQLTAGSTSRLATWQRALGLGDDDESRPEKLRMLDFAHQNVTVRAQGQTRIVEVLVDSPDPAVAAELANTLTNEFILLNLEARWTSTERTGAWLEDKLEEQKIALERSQDKLQQYARQHGLLYTGQQQSVAEEKLRQLQQDHLAAKTALAQRRSRFELAQTAPPEVLPDVINDPSLRTYQERLTELRREESVLATSLTAAHPNVKKVRAQIQTLETAFDRARDAILGRIRAEFQEAGRQEEILGHDYSSQAALVSSQSQQAIQYNILQGEVETNKHLYESMLRRVKETSVARTLSASNVRVVDPAKLPPSPYKPRRSVNILLGLMLGGFLGVVFIIVRERSDRTLQDPGDISLYLEIPELGVIPAAGHYNHTGGLLPYLRRRAKSLPAGQASQDAPPVNGDALPATHRGEGTVELLTWEHHPSAVAESFRTTLTSILFSAESGSPPRVIVLTSSQPSEGKTTVASNLAIAVAELSRRVLLIDGDFRRPRQHDIFGLAREDGLAEFLTATGPVETSLNGSIRATKVPGLFVLPAGADSQLHTRMLYSNRMTDLLEHLETQFDMILIDTPPLLNMPDARILGRMSDAVILVVKAGETTRDTALAARERLQHDGTHILGAILNAWEPEKSAGGYGYRYYYDKYYKSSYYANTE